MCILVIIVEYLNHLEEAAVIYLAQQQNRNQENVMYQMRIVPHHSPLLLQVTGDVKIIEIDIALFRKIKRNRYRSCFEQVWLDSDTVSPWRDGDQCRSQNGSYTPASPVILSVEEFISLTLNIGAKKNQNRIEIELFIKHWIKIESRGKIHNCHISAGNSGCFTCEHWSLWVNCHNYMCMKLLRCVTTVYSFCRHTVRLTVICTA